MASTRETHHPFGTQPDPRPDAKLTLPLDRPLSEQADAVPYKDAEDQWIQNVEALLSSGDPDVIRCHEGGGPEDLIMSLVLTMSRTRNSRDKALKPHEIADPVPHTGTSVLQPWVHGLPFMQQSVLLSSMRNADGVEKGHPSKDLIRWYRRCVVLSAFDGRALTDPTEPGGGSYTGPVDDIEKAADDFLRARDGMALHYYSHTMHSFQIVGVSHPDPDIREFWMQVYLRMVHALHVMPESYNDLQERLGDNPVTWKAREDKAGGCST